MQDAIFVTGMVLKQSSSGEYDRRVTILTKERGKVVAFARGARRQGNRLAAATNSFAFGTFRLYQGRDAYTLADADIKNYFEGLMSDYEGAYYGMYFAEIADYYARENNDEVKLLGLLYQSLKALQLPSIPRPLVRVIFECKAMAVNGEYPGAPTDRELSESATYALNYIGQSSLEKLYTFTVTEEVLREMQEVAANYCAKYLRRDFKSLEILKTLC
ncbi:MAG: DNA repair protein RecO [Lachnospiraceae bacterium]|nr:DNA repair protein RecO [Lachnospiraceae bacterium]MBQ2100715.1 DNA repair protein RecO [Lachnospiraceae bacterium]MBQ3906208.1 DNA repair protein RecO [Lachnospiraceae bacterium]MCR4597846.1 DNA repair protein RecO [Acetatifactor sp.]